MLLKQLSSPCTPELIHLFIHLFDTKCKLLSFTTYTVEIRGDAILNMAHDFSPQLSLKVPDGQLNQYYRD